MNLKKYKEVLPFIILAIMFGILAVMICAAFAPEGMNAPRAIVAVVILVVIGIIAILVNSVAQRMTARDLAGNAERDRTAQIAVCLACKREMSNADGCVGVVHIFKDGTVMQPLRYGQDRFSYGLDIPEKCHDCGCKKGEFHHVGCDMEICPRCQGQSISCSCE